MFAMVVVCIFGMMYGAKTFSDHRGRVRRPKLGFIQLGSFGEVALVLYA